eukprot:1859051-Prorocentrum_lima.AAC.1
MGANEPQDLLAPQPLGEGSGQRLSARHRHGLEGRQRHGEDVRRDEATHDAQRLLPLRPLAL